MYRRSGLMGTARIYIDFTHHPYPHPAASRTIP